VETAYTHALHTCAVHFIRLSESRIVPAPAPLTKISFSLRKLGPWGVRRCTHSQL